MAWYSVGVSSYLDLKGQEQFTNSPRIAQQFLSLKVDFDQLQADKGSGDRLSVNEARRSRSRQQTLYADYIRTGYPLAAYPYTSRHDEVTHGNALDVGVTRADGSNRALTDAEFDWMHTQCERRGFTWTGRTFATPEPWHIEGATRTEIVPPYPNADALVAAGPTITTPTTPVPEDITMIMFQVKGGGIFLAAPQFLTHYDNGAAAARDAARFKLTIETVELVEGQRLLGVFHVPWNYADAKQFRKAAPTGQWDSRGPVKAV